MEGLLEGVSTRGNESQVPPLRFAPVEMTRGGLLPVGKLATWMDRVRNDYSAKTAGPLRFAPVGMTRGGLLPFES
jgi:hypothetical protein